MFGFFRKKTAAKAATRKARSIGRPRLEVLEDRTAPAVAADIAVLGARLETPTRVQLTYQTSGNPGSFSVGVYRSADESFDPSDRLVATTLVTPPSGAAGGAASVNLGGEMPIDPARPHVLVVADPTNGVGETNEQNNTGSFRKLALGAVAHGYQPTGRMPGWVADMVKELQKGHYAGVIAIDWAQKSALPIPNMAVRAGQDLAAQIRLAASQLATRPTDVIDVHFIGHSRGTVVVSQALLSLQNNGGPAALQLGYYKMTLLDPHPARNRGSLAQGLAELRNGTGVSRVGGFSFNQASSVSRAVAAATLRFKSLANDPEVVIPRNVDGAEIYRQQIPWYAQNSLPERLLGLNLWAAPLASILNPSARPVLLVLDVGVFGVGHTSVPGWYINTVLR